MGLSGFDGGKMVKLWKRLELFGEFEGKLFKCDVCDFGIVTDNSVGEHMRNKHEGQGDDFWLHGEIRFWYCSKYSEVTSFFKIV